MPAPGGAEAAASGGPGPIPPSTARLESPAAYLRGAGTPAYELSDSPPHRSAPASGVNARRPHHTGAQQDQQPRLGQALLARYGKKRIIAKLAWPSTAWPTATVCAFVRLDACLHGRRGHAPARPSTFSACPAWGARGAAVTAGTPPSRTPPVKPSRDWVNQRGKHPLQSSARWPAPTPPDGWCAIFTAVNRPPKPSGSAPRLSSPP